jgi:hypothetical protein
MREYETRVARRYDPLRLVCAKHEMSFVCFVDDRTGRYSHGCPECVKVQRELLQKARRARNVNWWRRKQ